MKIGYVRVSTTEQNTGRQETLMEQLGVEKIYVDKCSGKNTKRPALKEMLEFAREDDIIVVESFSRLSRSTKDLISITEQLEEKGIKLQSQKEQIDTSTPQGKFFLTIMGALNQLEREVLLQRQKEGIAQARREGRYVAGRPRIQYDEDEMIEWLTKFSEGLVTMKALQKKFNCSASFLYSRLADYRKKGVVPERK